MTFFGENKLVYLTLFYYHEHVPIYVMESLNTIFTTSRHPVT